jgi:hypothetical protein
MQLNADILQAHLQNDHFSVLKLTADSVTVKYIKT